MQFEKGASARTAANPSSAVGPLEKELIRLHAAVRIRVEHVIRSLKRFRILAGRYRNRRRRFALAVNR